MNLPVDAYRELASLAKRFIETDGECRTAIDGLSLSRRSTPSVPCHGSYRPCLAMVLQGSKSLRLGSATINYATGEYLVTSLDLPVTWRVVEASAEAPHLCLSLAIDSEKLVDLLGRSDIRRSISQSENQWGISVNAAPAGLVDAVIRLLRLLDSPEDIPVMAPLIEQEILYRLLTGPSGDRLINIATVDSQANRIARAIGWLRQHFALPLRIEQLAEYVNMSPSSFHHHFKSITAMTPIQYQKQLRLSEARRLMLVERLDAGTAGHRVGYQSPSQFSREYSRLYGNPPVRDIEAA
ncbi:MULTISPECIES: AraC family transcriptional regulator [Brucella/Ochrobactrum group]|uniref:AraC family transcriptional regulator n=2 Tax=Ochrobactrum TaxID=528 RepID=A0A2P9HFD5_9HYPH|nr:MULTISPECIES: AraC family transcriptional regulator [Brucella]MCI0998863.1 AraC family transcriptional regulator [Ochrobactrum sp. C6C9]RRD26932.1 AraC family transcriptional regulator [Brucellaceae bacterium VT-16-1752]MDX4074877.1 AraC family transcriptional regulator [Brucella sp. NBRC 113783]NNU60576.1 AraC family transcriptional regulator [[Ochrobactrum] soli]RLL73759.1 AraC family transcriptional regulator [[Ochrobactrum] soli]